MTVTNWLNGTVVKRKALTFEVRRPTVIPPIAYYQFRVYRGEPGVTHAMRGEWITYEGMDSEACYGCARPDVTGQALRTYWQHRIHWHPATSFMDRKFILGTNPDDALDKDGRFLKEVQVTHNHENVWLEMPWGQYQVCLERALVEEVYRILYEEKDPRQALRDLMSRELKGE